MCSIYDSVSNKFDANALFGVHKVNYSSKHSSKPLRVLQHIKWPSTTLKCRRRSPKCWFGFDAIRLSTLINVPFRFPEEHHEAPLRVPIRCVALSHVSPNSKISHRCDPGTYLLLSVSIFVVNTWPAENTYLDIHKNTFLVRVGGLNIYIVPGWYTK